MFKGFKNMSQNENTQTQVVEMDAEALKQHQIDMAWKINKERQRNAWKRNYHSAELQRSGSF